METRGQGWWGSWRGAVVSLSPGAEVWAEPLPQELSQSCSPVMPFTGPDWEPFAQTRTGGGGLLWKGHSLRSRRLLWSGDPLPNSTT